MLSHTRIEEGEGQSSGSMNEEENIHRGAGADFHDWQKQLIPLWMTGYSNWLVYIHLATEGWLKEPSDILLILFFAALLRVK